MAKHTKKRQPTKQYFHSTYAENLSSIMREGLRPDIEPLYPEIAPGVYLTTSVDDAKWYAENYLEQAGERKEIVILRVVGLQRTALEQDPYEDTPGIDSFRYVEVIPPENIKLVERYMWPDDNP